MVRVIKQAPNKTATDVDHAHRSFGISISTRTARRILNRAKIFARRPAFKPMLKERHRRSRLAYGNEYRQWTDDDWGHVLFSDETKFNLNNPDGGQYVRRPVNERFNQRYVRETEKYGGGAVFAWGISGFKLTRNNLTIGCFSRNGVGPLVRIQGTMDAPQYRDILANHILPYAQEIMPSNWFFLQDNDPKHTSNLLMGALRTLPDSRKVRLPG